MTAYRYDPYPRWIYYQGGSKIVATADAHRKEQRIRPCYDSPADVPPLTGEGQAPPPAPAPAAAPVLKGEMVAAISAESAVVLDKYYTAPAKLVIARVEGVDSLDELREISDIEKGRPSGARKTVMAAVAHRIAKLTEQEVRRDEAAQDDEDS